MQGYSYRPNAALKIKGKTDARDKVCWWSREVTHSDNQNFEKEKKKKAQHGSEMSKQN